jgi:hypothetical protein
VTENGNNDSGQQRAEQDQEIVNQQNQPVDTAEDARERAEVMADAGEQANQYNEYEFDARVQPVVQELETRIRDLANEGDEAGVAHTRFALDVVIQRFRVAGVSTEGADTVATDEPPAAEDVDDGVTEEVDEGDRQQ